MAFVIADRVRETTLTTGTGSIALAGAVSKYKAFSSVLSTGDTTYYAIVEQSGSGWEVGIGTFTAPSTLARTTVLSSSNSGSLVSFVSGTKDVFITLPAIKTNVEDQPNLIEVNSSSDALRITQTGAGNALVVEDTANPDSTPFVIDTSGRAIVGTTTSQNSSYRLQSIGTNGGDLLTQRWVASSGGGFLRLQKSRGATIGTPGIVSNGDTIATLSFDADDGVGFIQAATIAASVNSTPGVNDMPGALVFSTTANSASSSTERMRINYAGQVGIGTSSLTNQRLRVQYNLSDTASTAINGLFDGVHTLTANNAFSYTGMDAQATLSQGGFNQTTSLASGGGVRGFRAFPTVSGAGGTVTAAVGYAADVRNTGTGILTNAAGYVAQGIVNSGGGTLTNAMGFYAAPQTGGTNNYGFYSDVASGTGRWNFYANGNAANYFAGNVGVGTTAPGSALDVKGTLRLSGSTSGYVGFAPAAAAGSTTYTLPAADGAANQVLSTDGAGSLSWVNKSAPRVLASTANSATPSLNTDNYDMMVITGQSVAITSFTTNLTGTPVNGQKLWIAITGTTAIAITWGASFESSTVTLPTTTVSTNRLDVGFVWNAETSKWRCVASA
jgi:hypothetical protein